MPAMSEPLAPPSGTGASRADYILNEIFGSSDCHGDSILAQANYPTGCYVIAGGAMSIDCTNSTSGVYYLHDNDPECRQPGRASGIMSGGCNVASSLSGPHPFGASATTDTSIRLSCVKSSQPYKPPADAESISIFTPQPACPKSIPSLGGDLAYVTTYAQYRKCLTFSDGSGAFVSYEFDCNKTSFLQKIWDGDRCGTLSSRAGLLAHRA